MESRSRGSVLLLALWSFLLLSVFAISLGYGIRQKLTLQSRLDALERLQSISISGIEKAKSVLKSDLNASVDGYLDGWANSELDFKELKMDGGRFSIQYPVNDERNSKEPFRYGLVDEERKINLNTADADTLSRLLMQGGELTKDQAEEVAYCVMDWRDTDFVFEHPNYGAEDDYYTNLDLPYKAKNGLFEVIDELLLVKGVTRNLFDKIKPFVTIYGTGQVNINTAPKEVLMALGLESDSADKIIHHRAGPDGLLGTKDDLMFMQTQSISADLAKDSSPLDLNESAKVTNLIAAQKLGVFSSYFTVYSHAVLENGLAALESEAVIDRNGKVRYERSLGVKWTSGI